MTASPSKSAGFAFPRQRAPLFRSLITADREIMSIIEVGRYGDIVNDAPGVARTWW